MAVSELSLEQIYEYFVQNGGIVSNRDIVRDFKSYLTDSLSKDDARIKFKKYVNILATTKADGNDKFLILKSKYATNGDDVALRTAQNDPRNSIGIPVSPQHTDYSPYNSPGPRLPPPYRPPPPVQSPSNNQSYDNISLSSMYSITDIGSPLTPQVPPRKKSLEQQRDGDESKAMGDNEKENESPENGDKQQTVSVKERTQKFNRLASVEDDLSPRQIKDKKRSNNNNSGEKTGVDEDDGASVTSLEQKKCVEWYVAAAKGDYQELVRLARNEPRLVKLKDPFTAYTVLHWAAKHGNMDIIKTFAGKYKVDVNAKSNGGYTPLHFAVQFGHKDLYDLLVQIYKADENSRDFSGRKPSQYKINKTQTGIKDSHNKDLGFLRIGSLNVRVKKTTEAFSNFLGVGSGGGGGGGGAGGGSVNPIDPVQDKVHKGWGSVDNVTQEGMPPPKNYAAKKKVKRSLEHTQFPPQIAQAMQPGPMTQDSDSDSAAGFDSNWQN